MCSDRPQFCAGEMLTSPWLLPAAADRGRACSSYDGIDAKTSSGVPLSAAAALGLPMLRSSSSGRVLILLPLRVSKLESTEPVRERRLVLLLLPTPRPPGFFKIESATSSLTSSSEVDSGSGSVG